MRTRKSQSSAKTEIATETQGLAVVRQRMPNLDRLSARALLSLAIGLDGSFRYVREHESCGIAVVFLGEIPCPVDTASLDQAAVERWLERHDGGDIARRMPPEDVLDDLLTQSVFTFARRDSAWIIAPAKSLCREIVVEPAQGGVKVEANLTAWDTITDRSTLALAEFLVSAQAGLRCARCELGSQSARAVCRIRSDDLSVHLMHGVRGVAAGVRGVAAATQMLAREASALLDPELARIYLEMSARPDWGPTAIAQVDDRAGLFAQSVRS
jgi:hypothetical protein